MSNSTQRILIGLAFGLAFGLAVAFTITGVIA